MCGRRTRGRRGRVRSSGVMCRVTAPRPEPGTCSASTSTAHRSSRSTRRSRGSTMPTTCQRRRLARVQRAVAEAMVRKKVEQEGGAQRDVQPLTAEEPRGIIDEYAESAYHAVRLANALPDTTATDDHRHRRPPHQARSHADAWSGRHPAVPGGEDGAHRQGRRLAHPRPPPAVQPRARELRHERGREPTPPSRSQCCSPP